MSNREGAAKKKHTERRRTETTERSPLSSLICDLKPILKKKKEKKKGHREVDRKKNSTHERMIKAESRTR